MDKYEELANRIIDDVCDIVEKQHPEINLNSKEAKECGIEEPAVIVGVDYYNLEDDIACAIKEVVNEN